MTHVLHAAVSLSLAKRRAVYVITLGRGWLCVLQRPRRCRLLAVVGGTEVTRC